MADDTGEHDFKVQVEVNNKQQFNRGRVLLYIPNIVGYIRLFLLLVAWYAASVSQISVSLVLFVISIALDGVDGHLARTLKQVRKVINCVSDIYRA